MHVAQIITIIQTVLAILLIMTVLLQQRGSGLSSAFGGSGSTYSTRRGVEKLIFNATIVIAALFFAISIARIFLTR